MPEDEINWLEFKEIPMIVGKIRCSDPPMPADGWGGAELETLAEIFHSCRPLARKDEFTAHECTAYVRCASRLGEFGTVSHGPAVQILPEPAHGMAAGLILLAVLARRRRG